MLRLVYPEGYENRGISTLSRGQAGWVALAQTPAPALRLPLLDEPLAALNEQFKYELVRDIRKILKVSDNTAFYVAHDQSGAELVAGRVSIMHQGEVVARGSLGSLRRNPSNPGIVKFLGL